MKRKTRTRTRIVAWALSLLAVVAVVAGSITLAFGAAGDTPPHTKKLTDNQDGTYTLSLDVVGESEKKPNPVNVIVILDHSGSMDTRTGGYGSQTRMAAAQNAVNNLARSLYAYNTSEFPNLVQMALVGFSTTGSITQGPTNSYSTFSGAVNRLDADGGTNWEDALQDATDVNFNDDDPTYVIFVSDGNPTFRNTRGNYNPMDNYYYQTWGVYGNGSDSQSVAGIPAATTIARCYEHAVDDAASLAESVGADHFYTIGAYGDVSRMQSLTTDAGAPAGNYFSAANTSDLEAALETILAEIEKAGIGSVEIEDGTTNQVATSSGVAELLEVDTDSFKYYKDGVEWADAPEAEFVDGAVEWDLSSVGVLDDGVKYTVTFDCYPSQYTYDTIAKLKNGDIKYSDLDPEVQKYIVDNGNGNYSLRTNTTATLDWDDTRTDDDEDPATYVNPDPVRTDSETLTINKEWEGGEPDVDEIDVTVMMDETEEFHTCTLTADGDWSDSSFISPGIIKNNRVLPGAEGHDFTFAELGDEQYHWELDSPVVHPMLIDGDLTMLVKVDDTHEAPSGAETYTIDDAEYYVDSSAAGLTATNHRRSNLNLTKIVTGEDAPEDATFPFTLTVNNSKAPDTEPADDPEHNSDYWVWFSIYDTNASATVTDATVSGATGPNASGYYYAPSGTDITVEMKDGWNLRFTNLPSGTTYTFAEGELDEGFVFVQSELTQGTDSTFSGDQTTTGTIENTKTSYYVEYTNDYALTNLEITKKWVDDDNNDNIRPTADEFKSKLTLSPAVEGVEPTVVDNGDNTYTITYTGLPKYNGDEEIEYTVAESAIDGYETTGSPAKDNGTITNTHENEVITVTVVKEWDDDDDSAGIRPDSITAQLKADGENSGDPVTLNEDNDWTYTWENLPKYNDGEEIEYTADETAVPAGYEKSGPEEEETDTGVSFTVTNTYNPTPVSVDPPVQKIITGNDDLYNGGDFTFTIEAVTEGAPMPENTSITNSADYELADKTGFYEFGPIEFTKPGTYEYKVTESGSVDGVTNDPDAETGKTLTFTVTDDGEGNLTVDPTTDQVQLSFTNVYAAEGEVVLEAKKVLEGRDWKDDESFTFTLYDEDGTEIDSVEVTSDNADSVTFDAIKYDLSDAGETYTYTISETSELPAGVTKTGDITATVEVSDDGHGTMETNVSYNPADQTITNTYTADPVKAKISVAKKIDGYIEGEDSQGNVLDRTFTVTMEGPKIDGQLTTTITTNGGTGTAEFGEIEYTFDDMVDDEGNHVTEKQFTYTVKETAGSDAGFTYDENEYEVVVTVKDNLEGKLEVTDITKLASETNVEVVNEYQQESVDVTLTVNKKVIDESNSLEGDATFTFVLNPVGDAPGEAQTKTITTNNAGSVNFDTITFTEAGEYEYTIEESGSAPNGWTYDTTVHNVKVVVDNNFNAAALEESTTIDGEKTFSVTFENKYKAAATEATLLVTKEVEDTSGSADDVTFEFTIAGDGDAPMPENTTAYAKAGETAEFGPITYEKAGTFAYTITETKGGNTAAGWTNDTTHTVDVFVSDTDAQLNALVCYDGNEGLTELTFVNTYDPKDATATPKARKVVDDQSNSAPDETFTFELKDADGNVVDTQTVENGGPVTFAEQTFDKVGTYTYTIQEVAGSTDGFTYDTDARNVTIKVTDPGDGQLKAEVTYDGGEAVITNVYKAEPTSIVVDVNKEITGLTGTEKDATFTFKLTGSGKDMTATVTGAGSTSFDEIKYTKAGTYTYTVTEVNDGQAGYTYDGTVYTVKVNVVDEGAKLIANTTITVNGEETDSINFVNPYKPLPTSAPITASKVLEGRSLKAGEFTFQLMDGEGNVVATAKNAADGSVDFGSINFDEAGTYTYTASELKGTDKKITYDTSVKTYTVEVEDVNGQLVATVTCDDDTATFTNKYTPDKPKKPEEPKRIIPRTGDPAAAANVITLSAMGTASLLTGLRMRRKKK